MITCAFSKQWLRMMHREYMHGGWEVLGEVTVASTRVTVRLREKCMYSSCILRVELMGLGGGWWSEDREIGLGTCLSLDGEHGRGLTGSRAGILTVPLVMYVTHQVETLDIQSWS